jgi:hypothetical protein
MGRMGFMDRQREVYAQMAGQMRSLLVPGEVMYGIIVANQQKTFSATLYLVATTDRRIMMQPVDRKWQPNGQLLSFGPNDISNTSVWGWAHDAASKGEKIATFLTTSGDRIKFEAGGEKWKLMTLGGNLLENLMSTEEQSGGLDAFLRFLAAADPRARG